MSKPSVKEVLLNPIFANNPIGLQILGICSALAVTSNLKTALVMSIALTLVTAFSNLFISMIRSQIPGSNPLVVKAVGLDNHNGNPILSVADANRVLIENGATGFLDRTNVVFVR